MDLLRPMMVMALLLGGMGVAILGSIKVPLARRLQIDEGKVGGLVSIFAFAMIPVMLTAGFLTDSLGLHVVFLAGSVVYSVSLFVLAGASSYVAALSGVLLLSAGWSLLINAGNVLIKAAFPGDSTAFSTNIGNVFFGLGAFLTPLLTSLLVRVFSLRPALMLLGLVALLPGALSFGVEFPAATATPGATATTFGDLLLDPYLWLLGFALFFYGPLEASLGAWTTTYLAEKGYKESSAANWLAVFWLAFMSSRLIAAFTMPPDYETTLLLVLAIASVMVLADMVTKGRRMAVAPVLLSGFVLGPIFPTLMALLLDHFRDKSVHGRAIGLFFAIGGIGWTMIPMLIGAYARRTSVQRGFIVAVAAALGLCGVALALTAV